MDWRTWWQTLEKGNSDEALEPSVGSNDTTLVDDDEEEDGSEDESVGNLDYRPFI